MKWTEKNNFEEKLINDDNIRIYNFERKKYESIKLTDYLNSFLENEILNIKNIDILKNNQNIINNFFEKLKEKINIENITNENDTNIEQAEKLEKIAEDLKKE